MLVPALLGYYGEATCTKAVATNKDEFFEAREILSEMFQIFVGDRHAFQVDFFEPRIGGAQGGDPRGEVGPPFRRHEVEVGEPRPALDSHGPDPGEPGCGPSGRDGVTVPDEELGSGQGLDPTPRLADQ